MPHKIPKHLFSQPLKTSHTSILAEIPRIFSEDYNIYSAQLGEIASPFMIIEPTKRATLSSLKSIIQAMQKIDSSQLVIFSPYLDLGIMKALSSEGIAYIKDTNNAFLPFLAMAISETAANRTPKMLSAQAQRIAINFISGKWTNITAGEIASRAQVSRSTITNSLAEIQAILPSTIVTEWKKRILKNPGLSKEELLDTFDPFLISPVRKRIHLSSTDCLPLLKKHGALLSNESALPNFSDLASPEETIFLALHKEEINMIEKKYPQSLVEANWFEQPALILEEWAYKIDERYSDPNNVSSFDSLDALSLYVEMKDCGESDIRLLDAITQLREIACQ